MMGDALRWAASVPAMLVALEDSGLTIIHQTIDHHLLIDRPIFVCLVTTQTMSETKGGKSPKKQSKDSPSTGVVSGSVQSGSGAGSGDEESELRSPTSDSDTRKKISMFGGSVPLSLGHSVGRSTSIDLIQIKMIETEKVDDNTISRVLYQHFFNHPGFYLFDVFSSVRTSIS